MSDRLYWQDEIDMYVFILGQNNVYIQVEITVKKYKSVFTSRAGWVCTAKQHLSAKRQSVSHKYIYIFDIMIWLEQNISYVYGKTFDNHVNQWKGKVLTAS